MWLVSVISLILTLATTNMADIYCMNDGLDQVSS